MRNAIRLILAMTIMLGGCSSLDFFGYEDNSPLHVIQRPDGYPSVMLGAQIAPTFFHQGESSADLVAVSAGSGYPTLFYRLSADGKLVDVEDPYDEYLNDEKLEAESMGSGSSLVGLPSWEFDGLYTGCVAIGEPMADRVTIVCEQDKEIFHIGSGTTGVEDLEGFGFEMAGIRPSQGDGWLLAVSSFTTVTVFSSSFNPGIDRSDTVSPLYDGSQVPAPINEIAAGHLSNGTFFVAAATADAHENVPSRIHLFVQDGPNSTGMTQVACLNRSGVIGFGGVMVTGDLDGDGNAELITSQAAGEPTREDLVEIWRISDLVDAAPTCNSEEIVPAATVTPGDGPLKISCDTDSDCEFGFSLAVGDIATDDGGPELIVGAPGAKVDGVVGAGAVYVYRGVDLISNGTASPAGRIADSTPRKGYRFGGGVAVSPMAGRNELLVGATGKGRLIIAYCTGVGEDLEAGADVTTNAGGSIISTRCRPK
jgi:hypothetical protein